MKLYDKRDDFNFPIVFECSNIPAAPAYGIYRYQLKKGCYKQRSYWTILVVKLKSSLQKLFGHHHGLVNSYRISV